MADLHPTEPRPRPGGGAALVVLAALIGASCVVRGAFGTVQEAAKLSLGLDDLRLGLVQGLAMSIPIAILSIPLGRAVDRANRVRLMLVLGVIWSAGAIGTAFAQGFATLFVARMAAGLGSTCGIPAAISIAADYCRPERRGRAMLVLTVGQWAGVAGGFAVGGALIGAFGAHRLPALAGLEPWRATNLVIGLGSALLLLLFLLVREPARHEAGEGAGAPFAAIARELWGMRAFLAPLFIGQVGVVMADAAAGIWVAPVLGRRFHLAPDQFGGWIGAIVFGSGVAGSILGGLLADAGQRSPRRGGILLSAVIASLIAIPSALFPLAPSLASFGAALTLLLGSGTLMGLVTATALAVLLPNELRGVCLGAFIAVAGVIGFGLAPTLVTLVATARGGTEHLADGLAIVGVCVGLVSTAGFAIAMRNAPAIR